LDWPDAVFIYIFADLNRNTPETEIETTELTRTARYADSMTPFSRARDKQHKVFKITQTRIFVALLNFYNLCR
jgi:hypothetical protein